MTTAFTSRAWHSPLLPPRISPRGRAGWVTPPLRHRQEGRRPGRFAFLAALTTAEAPRYGAAREGGSHLHGAEEPLSGAPDQELIEAIAAGDRGALGLLYDRYSPLMLGVGHRLLGSRREAEDLLQDVFLEVWRQAGTYDPSRGSVRAWVLIRLRSRALDRKRAPVRSRTVSLDASPILETAAAHFEDPSLGLDRQRVHAALGALTIEQRLVLELAYFEGLSSSEIADRLTVPIGTVKSRTATALARLRLALGRDDGERS